MIYQLPTRSSRRYRGKYPMRVNSMSYSSRSPESHYIKDLLSFNAGPVHIELNEGTRFIVSMDEFSGFEHGPHGIVGQELPLDTIQRATAMSQSLYDIMLTALRRIRKGEPNDGAPLAIAS